MKKVCIIMVILCLLLAGCSAPLPPSSDDSGEIAALQAQIELLQSELDKMKSITETMVSLESTTDVILSVSQEFRLADMPIGDEWNKYCVDNNYESVKVVKRQNGTLGIIIGVAENYNPVISFDTRSSNGLFMAVYLGEFGGQFVFFQPFNDYLYEIDDTGVITGFYTLGNNDDIVYYLGGGSGFLSKGGYIGRLIKKDSTWENDENYLIKLPYTDTYDVHSKYFINTFCVVENTVYISTNQSMFTLQDDILTEWLKIRATSMVYIDGILYFGGFGWIIAYNLDNNELCWYEQVAGNEIDRS